MFREKSRTGLGMVEYALIFVFMAVLAIGALSAIGAGVKNGSERVNSALLTAQGSGQSSTGTDTPPPPPPSPPPPPEDPPADEEPPPVSF